MPSPEDVFQDLEAARALRESEVRTLRNLAESEKAEEAKLALRRSLVLVAYAHFEGFCKGAMDTYVTAVNSIKLPCSDATPPLVAATLHKAFGALRDVNIKHPLFPSSPEDFALHLSWRESRLAEQLDAVMSTPVDIPDGVINTESNLKPDVLKRNMYRLGLSFVMVDAERGNIHKLLGKRNEIAHGEMVAPSAKDVDDYIETAFKLMQYVQDEIFDALVTQAYRKKAAA